MIAPSEFAARRQSIKDELGPHSAVLLAAAPRPDPTLAWRQCPDFLYLTGIEESPAVLCLLPGREQGEDILFCQTRCAEHERWHGPVVGLNHAKSRFFFDDAFPIEDLEDILPNLIESRNEVLSSSITDRELHDLLRARASSLRPIEPMLSEKRLRKSQAELASLAKAADISIEAHERARHAARSGSSTSDILATLMHSFFREGAQPAYPPIVAAGRDAWYLHPPFRQRTLRRGDTLLIDAGARVDGYSADVTRTVVIGNATPEQHELHRIVCEALDAALEQLHPGGTLAAAHAHATQTAAKGLSRLGLLPSESRAALVDPMWCRAYPHKTCHWLGLDVHDSGSYLRDGRPRPLTSGMAVACEPGLYMPRNQALPRPWRGRVCRLEDTIVVTGNGHRNLSAELSRELVLH